MPWIRGDSKGTEVLKVSSTPFALNELLEGRNSAYIGYLLDGFGQALERGDLDAERPLVSFKAGWPAVTVAAVTKNVSLIKELNPFVVPVTARPYPAVPLGFALFSAGSLLKRLNRERFEKHPSLEWAVRLSKLVDAQHLALCDSELELNLLGVSAQEAKFLKFKHPRLRGALRSLEILLPGYAC